MGHLCSMLNGLGLGALAMYFLDPVRGRYRRALVRDQCFHWSNSTQHAMEVGWRDLGNRTSGWMAELQSAVSQGPVSDEILEQRVRAHLGHAVSHPKAIEVKALEQRVQLSGHILAGELNCVLDCVKNVPGVQDVENNLQVHENAADHPELQGHDRRGNQPLFNPATQFVVGSAVCMAATYVLARRAPLATLLGAGACIAMAAESRALQNQRLAGRSRQQAAHEQEPTTARDNGPKPRRSQGEFASAGQRN